MGCDDGFIVCLCVCVFRYLCFLLFNLVVVWSLCVCVVLSDGGGVVGCVELSWFDWGGVGWWGFKVVEDDVEGGEGEGEDEGGLVILLIN